MKGADWLVLMVVMANKIETAHQMYRDGNYEEALGFYTEALSMAKTKPQKIALHSNRAACYLKLHDFKKVSTIIFFNDFEIKGSCYFMPRKWFVMYNLDFWILIFDGLASFLCKKVLCYVKIGYLSSGF